MTAITSSFSGDKELAKKLESMSKELPKITREALKEIGAEKLALTSPRVPYKTGKLHDSGRFSVRVGEKQVMLTITYGGPDAPYAIRVHEDLEARHGGGRRAKFLESVILEAKPTIGQDIIKKIDLRRAL